MKKFHKMSAAVLMLMVAGVSTLAGCAFKGDTAVDAAASHAVEDTADTAKPTPKPETTNRTATEESAAETSAPAEADKQTEQDKAKPDTAHDAADTAAKAENTAAKPAPATLAAKPCTQAAAPAVVSDSAAAQTVGQSTQRYTFTVRNHPATCTEVGYDEHICAEWGGANYNDNYQPATGHDWGEGVVTKAATYTAKGEKTFTCKICGATRTEELPELDKTYHVQKIVAPTCMSEGYTIYECNEKPGLTYKADYTAKLPHSYDEGVVTKEPTIYAPGERLFTCKDCGTTRTEGIPMLEKTWHKGETVAPTCESGGYTLYICDQDESLTEQRDQTAALGHDWGEGIVTTAATCDADGKRTYTCARDSATKTEVIPALGHDWGEGIVTTAATCTTDGERIYTCARDAAHTKTEVIPATGHSYDAGVVTKEPTYKEDGMRTFTCTSCGDTYTEVIPAKQYTFTETVVAPTCTEQGYTLHKCNEDDAHSYKDNYQPATGHAWLETTTPATCTEDGHVDRMCTRCGETQLVSTLPKTGAHSWDAGIVTTEPTCSGTGVMTYTCTNCGETKTETIPAKGHHFNGYGDSTGWCTNINNGEECDLSGDYNHDAYISAVFADTNAARTKYGLAPLGYRSDLQYAADARANDLLYNYLTYGDWAGKYGVHARPDGKSPAYAINDEDTRRQMNGENAGLFPGLFNSSLYVASWMNSDGHRAAILGDSDGIAIGLTEYNGKIYAIQMFLKTTPDWYAAETADTVVATEDAAETESTDTAADTVEVAAPEEETPETVLAADAAQGVPDEELPAEDELDKDELDDEEAALDADAAAPADESSAPVEDTVPAYDQENEFDDLMTDEEYFFMDEKRPEDQPTLEVPAESITDDLYAPADAEPAPEEETFVEEEAFCDEPADDYAEESFADEAPLFEDDSLL